jgi:hypothetical protein
VEFSYEEQIIGLAYVANRDFDFYK